MSAPSSARSYRGGVAVPTPFSLSSARSKQEAPERGSPSSSRDISWFRGRLSELMDRLKAKQQITRHKQRLKELGEEKEKLMTEKSALALKKSQAVEGLKDKRRELQGLLGEVDRWLIRKRQELMKVKEERGEEEEGRDLCSQLESEMRKLQEEKGVLEKKLNKVSERLKIGVFLKEEDEARLEDLDDELEALDAEIEYQEAEIGKLAAANQQAFKETEEENGWPQRTPRGRDANGVVPLSYREMEGFLSELGGVTGSMATTFLQEACKELLELKQKFDRESSELAVVQLRLDQKTSVCSDFAKALQKTKTEFSRRLARQQKENEDKLQYLLKQLREYERGERGSHSTTPRSLPGGRLEVASRNQEEHEFRDEKPRTPTSEGDDWRDLLGQEKMKVKELERVNKRLMLQIKTLRQYLPGEESKWNADVVKGNLVRISSKVLKEVPPPAGRFKRDSASMI